MNRYDFLGWVGSVVMVAFSFTLVVPFALLGLSLLTIQAIANRTYNLIALNAVSIVGFTSNCITFCNEIEHFIGKNIQLESFFCSISTLNIFSCFLRYKHIKYG